MDIGEIKKELSTSEYKEAKLKFRQSGIKQHLKPITEAVNALNHISSLGVKINIITSRPHIQFNCRNTLNWLQNISLNFHHLYFCRRKETLIFYPKKDEYFIIIDDNEDFLIQYAEIENTKTLLMSKSLDSRTKFWKNLEDLVIAKTGKLKFIIFTAQRFCCHWSHSIRQYAVRLPVFHCYLFSCYFEKQ